MLAEAIGRELSSIGIKWFFTPALNTITPLSEPLDACERFSDDVQTVDRHSSVFIKGLDAGGIGSCAKVDLTPLMEEMYRSSIEASIDVEELLSSVPKPFP